MPFYITYIVDVGINIPWNDNSSYVIVVPEKGKTVQSEIKDPVSMSTKTCFIVIENESSAQLIMKRGSGELHPENENDVDKTILLPKESGVYSVSISSFGNFSQYKLQTSNNIQISFPENFTAFESGKIFTIVVTDENEKLSSAIKSISPFDIDTRRQIWTSEPVASQYSVDCVRSAYDVKDGSFYAGSVLGKANTVFIEAFDVYGKVTLHEEFLISPGGSYQGDCCEIVDAVQTSSGNYLLLVRQYLVGYSDENSFYYILSADKDGNEKSVLNLSAFAQSNSFENVWFYGNVCKGALCPIDDNKCGIFGSVWNSSGEMYYLAALADFSNSEPTIEKYWKSPDSCSLFEGEYGTYKTFTSGWYDSTSSSFYVAGYNNFSRDYSNPQHSGVIYKISSDCSDSSEEKSFDRTLFFGITGKDGKYYACGETMGSTSDGNLYGGFISRQMVDSSQEIIRYRSTKENAYFTQINFTNNGLALCGSNSDSSAFDSTNTEGILACYSTSGVKLWENNYSDYQKIASMTENNIGTQILHVVKTDGTSKILSTDLLGRECK